MVDMEYIVGCAVGGAIIYHGFKRYKKPSLKKYFNNKIEKSIRIGEIILGVNILVLCLIFLFNN